MNKFIGVCALFLSLTAFGGECDSWNLPEEQPELQEVNERIALYTDNMKAGAFAAAVEPLEWLLVNNPDLHKSLYINGVKIYSRLAMAEADNGKSRAYRDRVAELYDARLSLCKGSGEVYNRKALDLYKLNRAD